MDLEKKREQAQLDIDSAKNIEARRKSGQFATPFPLELPVLKSTHYISTVLCHFGTRKVCTCIMRTLPMLNLTEDIIS